MVRGRPGAPLPTLCSRSLPRDIFCSLCESRIFFAATTSSQSKSNPPSHLSLFLFSSPPPVMYTGSRLPRSPQAPQGGRRRCVQAHPEGEAPPDVSKPSPPLSGQTSSKKTKHDHRIPTRRRRHNLFFSCAKYSTAMGRQRMIGGACSTQLCGVCGCACHRAIGRSRGTARSSFVNDVSCRGFFFAD